MDVFSDTKKHKSSEEKHSFSSVLNLETYFTVPNESISVERFIELGNKRMKCKSIKILILIYLPVILNQYSKT